MRGPVLHIEVKSLRSGEKMDSESVGIPREVRNRCCVVAEGGDPGPARVILPAHGCQRKRGHMGPHRAKLSRHWYAEWRKTESEI